MTEGGNDALLTKCAKGQPSAPIQCRVHQNGCQVRQRTVRGVTGMYDAMYEVKNEWGMLNMQIFLGFSEILNAMQLGMD